MDIIVNTGSWQASPETPMPALAWIGDALSKGGHSCLCREENNPTPSSYHQDPRPLTTRNARTPALRGIQVHRPRACELNQPRGKALPSLRLEVALFIDENLHSSRDTTHTSIRPNHCWSTSREATCYAPDKRFRATAQLGGRFSGGFAWQSEMSV